MATIFVRFGLSLQYGLIRVEIRSRINNTSGGQDFHKIGRRERRFTI